MLYPKHFVNVLLIHHMECGSREKEILDIATIMRHGLTLHKNSMVMDINTNNDTNPLGLLEYFTTSAKSEESLKSIETHEISDIFQPFETKDGLTTTPKFILIEGAAGMGKTTLCKEIAYQWSKQCLLKDTKLLFLIYLCDPAISYIKHIKDLIHYCYNFDKAATELSKQCAKILINRNNNDITIVFDGYDEFDNSSDSLITNILSRSVLPQCRIVVTSRFTSSERLHRIADVRVEILGFTDESKIQYIKQELKDHPDKMKLLVSYLNDHPSIKSICYMPMMMTILVYVFKEKGHLPNNSTELYSKFVALAISHYLQKQNQSEHLFISLQTLPKEHESFLNDLSKFAFLTLQSKQKVFSEEDIENLCPNSTLACSNLDKLGLIKSVEYFCTDKGNSYAFNFLHLSIHEYLAAYYISSIDQSRQFNELENTFLDGIYQEAWSMFIAMNKKATLIFQGYCIYCKDMYCGILSSWIESVGSLSILESIPKLYDIINTNAISSNVVQVLFSETNQSCNSAANAYQSKSYLSLCSRKNLCETKLELFIIDRFNSNWFKHMHLTNRFSIVFHKGIILLLGKANQQQIVDSFKFTNLITHIVLVDCHISTAIIHEIKFSKLRYLLSFEVINCTFEHNTSLSVMLNIILQDSSFYTVGMNAVSSVISSYRNLKFLVLRNNNLQNNVIEVAEALKHTRTLKVLDLTSNNIPQTATAAISTIVSSNTSLRVFCIGNNKLKSSIVVILQHLSKICLLQKLELYDNEIPEKAGEAIASVILNNNALERLLLNSNNIGKGILPIAKALQQINSLKVLGLHNTNIPKEVSGEIAAAIQCNQNLYNLQLGGNDLEYSANTILQVISKISSLEVLDLQSNQLTKEFGEVLGCVVLSNTCLNQLLLNNNNIGKGISYIAKSLQRCSSLQVLGLANTNIPMEACNELALAIECNQGLNTLLLNGNNLQSSAVVILQALSKISSLKVLDLQSNQLTEDAGEYLSYVILNNTGLNQLLLDNNYIGKGVSHIAKALQRCSSLQVLRLANTNMPMEACNELALAIECNQCLSTLRLNGNNLQSSAVVILQALSKISSLKFLNLQSNQLTEDAGEYLSSVILNNTGLNQLLLDNNYFGKGMSHIAKALQRCSSLWVLGLANTNMPMEACNELALAIECNQCLNTLLLNGNNLQCSSIVILQALSKISSLKVLGLQSNQLTEDAGEYLSYVILNNTGLNRLLLDNSYIGKGMSHIAKALQRCSSLQVLRLANTNMPTEVYDDLITAIECNPCLCNFQLSGNDLQSSAYDILQALSKISSLEILDLRGNKLNKDADKLLASVILNNTVLKYLYLGHNNIGIGMMKVAKALQQITSIKFLDLGNTNMPKEVSDDLALAIKTNQGLEMIWLFNNDLSTSTIITIVSPLCTISTLTVLDLDNNQITEECGEVLGSIILQNVGIEQLLLNNNRIGKGVMHIAKALQQVNCLKVLGLNNNGFPKEVCVDIALAIESNRYLNTLQICGNNMETSAIVIVILQSLCKVSSLQILDLQSNQLSEDIGELLAGVVISNRNVHELQLGNNNISKGLLHVVKALQQIRFLQVLGLNNTNIPMEACNELPLAIECNQGLNTLLLNGNNLQCSSVVILQALSKISSLKVLHLQSSQLTEDAGEYLSYVIRHNTGINHLLLNNNHIGKGMSHIVKALQRCSSLWVLGLANANMPMEACNELALAIECNQCLNTLLLNDNNLQSSAIFILQALSKILSLKFLNLQSNQLTEDAGEYLSSVILNNTGLNQLLLDNNYIGKGMSHIAKALQRCSSLWVLRLANTNLPMEACNELALAIECNQCLNTLLLNGNNLQCSSTVILQALSKISSLKVLGLQSNQLTEDAGEYLSSVILNNTGLNQLLLDNNCIGKGMSHIAKALQRCSSLWVLGLANTNMPMEACNELALAIECNQCLNTLLLNGNNLQCSSIVILQALSKISSLKVLGLQSNQLTEDAGEYLSYVILNNTGLNRLLLDNSYIGKGMSHIAKALQRCSSLQVLRLANTNMPTEVYDDLITAIECNPCLCNFQLSGNDLQSSAYDILQALSKISSLEILDLRGNKLNKDADKLLASVILNNTVLKYLYLGHNNIGIGMMKVAKALQQITSIKFLDLGNTNMPKEVSDDLALAIKANQGLEMIWLFNNDLSTSTIITIVSPLCTISTLTVLDLDNNQITEECGEVLGSIILQNVGIEQLLLNNNRIGKGVMHIAKALQQVNCLKVLGLNNNGFPKEVCVDIALAIESNRYLNTLQICGNNMETSAIVIVILQSLCKVSSLQILDLQSNQLSEDIGELLAGVVISNRNVHELQLGNNNISKGLLHVVKALQQIRFLQVLGLNNTNIPMEACNELALAIECNQGLNTLLLNGNNLQCSSVVILQALSKISSLKVLHLQSSQLTEDAGEYLSYVIRNNTEINHLLLNNNHIGKGMSHIVKALQRCSSLQVLGLANINMPMEVYDDLITAIECNPYLCNFQLSGNDLQSSAYDILQALSKISSLETLGLQGNKLNKDADKLLASVILNNNILKYLYLCNNNIGKGMMKVAKALQQITSIKFLDFSNTNMPKEVSDDLALAIKANKGLEEIWLHNNDLSSSSIITIVSPLCTISTLTVLDLDNNQITEECGEVLESIILQNVGIEQLLLNNNRIGKGVMHIAKALQQVNCLKVLGLNNNGLPKEACVDIALAIESNRYLNTLRICGNNIETSAIVILQSLCKISSLHIFDLQSNQLNEDVGELLAGVVISNHNLNELQLSTNNISEGLLHVAKALQQIRFLQVLGLNNTNMPMEVSKELSLAIECNQCLNTLLLNGNNLQCSSTVILQALSKISSLKVLGLQSNQLTEDAGEYLSSVILNNTGLNQLLLDNNCIGKGMSHIAKALQRCSSLWVLGLANTNMPMEACNELALAIECNQCLNTLLLNGNNLQCSSIVILQALSKISSLKVLGLQSNQLTEDAGEYLSYVILNNTGLNQLLLDNNYIGKGMSHIAKALQRCSSLQVLRLANTNMPMEACNELALAIECNQCLSTLRLNGNNLQSSAVVILQALSKISSLKFLNLQSNQLTEDAGEYLSSVILNNTGLNQLLLDNNYFGKGMSHIAKALQRCSSLWVLGLAITNVPMEACNELALAIECNQCLNTLLLNGNNLQCSSIVILQALSKISSLKVLGLQSNQLTEDAGEYLSYVILNNTGLNRLLLDNSYFGKGMSHIAKALQRCSSLQVLRLANTNMPTEVYDDLITAIECNPCLCNFQLSGNDLQSSAYDILQALSKISSLEILDLRGNKLNKDADKLLASVILNNTVLKYLYLGHNNIGIGMMKVAKALQQITSIKFLDLGNTNMPKEVSDDLALAIKANQGLEMIWLFNNDLSTSTIITIVSPLCTISTLTVLDLDNNQITEECGEVLGSIILQNVGIEQLLLNNNRIGKGVMHIAKALQQVNCLKVLGLNNNGFPKEVCVDIALAIESNRYLNTLQICGNNMETSAIVIVILQSLCKVSSLQILDLQSNQLSEDIGELLAGVVISNRNVHELQLGNNNISKGLLHVVKALQQIRFLQVLGLNNTNIPMEACNELPLAIECNQGLNTLLLNGNNLQCSSVVILQALSKISSLKVLHLQSSQLTEDAGEYLSYVIRNNTGINHLLLNNNHIGKGMSHIVKALQRCSSLWVLGLANANMPMEACNELALAIECNQCLNTLLLNDNNLQSSAIFILQALSKILSLKFLNLQSNQLTEDAGEYLSSVILNNTGLIQLLLDNNYIGKGMSHIAKALQRCSSLQVLGLANTDMSMEACNELALAIECNQCLSTLKLHGNDLHCSSVVILQALSYISSLKVLHLQSNQLTEDAGEYLSSVILNNTGLNELFLDNNNIGKGVLPIAKALKQVNSLQVISVANTNMPMEVSKELALAIECNQCLKVYY